METFIDSTTGIEWGWETDQKLEDWNSAVDYGTDQFGPTYRLPFAMELFTLIDYTKYNSALRADLPNSLKSGIYWTQQIYAKSTGDVVWCCDMIDGHFYPCSSSNVRYIICVKGV